MKKNQDPSQSIRILQISDTHLFENPDECLLKLNTQKSTEAVLAHIQKKREYFDLVLLTGDLSQDSSPTSYARLASMLEFLKPPIYWIPGNHDHPDVMQKSFAQTFLNAAKHIITAPWQFILLNSHLPGSPKGYLASDQLDFLEQTLTEYPDYLTAIVIHHHVQPVESTWLDTSVLINHEEFFERIAKFNNIKTIIHGHIHQALDIQSPQNIRLLGLPSTSIQFKPKSHDFALDNVAPGYRTITLHPNGEIQSEVHRVTEFSGRPDFNSTGY
jgi:Icc protein